MSSGDIPDAATPAVDGEPRERLSNVVETDYAKHLSGEEDEQAAIVRDAVLSDRGLLHVAHYVNSVYEFAVDVLADPALAGELAGSPLDRKRAACLQAGRELSYSMVRLDHSLREVQSGALIRAVFHSTTGAIICNRVIPREYIVALVLDGSATAPDLPLVQSVTVRDADRAVAELATRLRSELSLGPQNPGGWLTSYTPTKSDGDDAVCGDSPVTTVEVTGRIDHPLGEACRKALSTADLHYVAHFHHDQAEFSVDCLDERALRRFFLHISPTARRKFYLELGRQFTMLSRQFFQVVFPVIGGPLARIVLDIEQGAIYFYRLAGDRYLVGVTLNQGRVSQADDKMAALAAAKVTDSKD